MPSWVQELNTDYIEKKKSEAFFLKKHQKTSAQAYAAREGTEWFIGDEIEIIKTGSQHGDVYV
jgi:hypothetical protein